MKGLLKLIISVLCLLLAGCARVSEEPAFVYAETGGETLEIKAVVAETGAFEPASETDYAVTTVSSASMTSAETHEIGQTGTKPEEEPETDGTIAAESQVNAESETAEEETETDAVNASAGGLEVRGVTYIQGIPLVNKTYSLPEDYNPGVSDEAAEAFEKMKSAAADEGLDIYISSGFRSYDYQRDLYNRYVSGYGQEEADTFSARPGHSEHQLGLAFDLNSIDDSFINTAEGGWVKDNCHEYGFIIRYPLGKEEITGYKYEPWHIRYVGEDMAAALYESGLTLEEYFGVDSEY